MKWSGCFEESTPNKTLRFLSSHTLPSSPPIKIAQGVCFFLFSSSHKTTQILLHSASHSVYWQLPLTYVRIKILRHPRTHVVAHQKSAERCWARKKKRKKVKIILYERDLFVLPPPPGLIVFTLCESCWSSEQEKIMSFTCEVRCWGLLPFTPQ